MERLHKKILALLALALLAGLPSWAGSPLDDASWATQKLYTRCVHTERPSDDLFKNLKLLPGSVTREMAGGVSLAYNLSFAGRPVILYNHGQGETIDDLERFFTFAQNHKLNMISWDYPCYGKTPGRPSEQTLTDAGVGVLKWLAQKSPKTPVVLWGQSLGAAVALQIFRRNFSGDKISVSGLVVISPWDTFKNACADLATFIFCTDHKIKDDQYDSLAAAKLINVPVIFVYSAGDRKIMKKRSAVVAQAVPATFATVLELDSTITHEHLADNSTLEKIAAFIEEKIADKNKE